jgi:hypothetical protein
MTLNTSWIRQIKTAAAVLICFGAIKLAAQNDEPGIDLGQINGSFQADGQYYFEDTAIGAPAFPGQLGSNSFVTLNYNRGRFNAGLRYEAYLPTLQGYNRDKGSGIPYRFAQYSHEKFDVTVGSFYEQFGSGMVFRAYESWGLGFDNCMEGLRTKFTPVKGVALTGIIGRQRNAFSNSVENLSEGIVRGGDFEVSINDLFDSLATSKVKVHIGGNFVSRYQPDTDPIQIYPENVAAMSGRAKLNIGKFSLFAEYAYKINDPTTVNTVIYKPGNGILVEASYARKGLGVSFTAKRIDNMDFRSDRSATFNNLNLNFLPPQSKQHTYRLATLFPYATQALGEQGMQLEVFYNIPKGSTLGGKYGTTLSLNISNIHGLKTTPDTLEPEMGYHAEPFALGKLYFQDINLEISRKFSPKFKASFTHLIFQYDKTLFKALTGLPTTEDVTAHVDVLETTIKIKSKHTLRTELQHAATKQEFGSWAMALAEYTIAPHWFAAVFDEYNYGNKDPHKRIHYFSGQVGYLLDNYRIVLGYGRQRAGVLCVGGVCRFVPASNGFTLSVSGTF